MGSVGIGKEYPYTVEMESRTWSVLSWKFIVEKSIYPLGLLLLKRYDLFKYWSHIGQFRVTLETLFIKEKQTIN